jgi:cytochrome c-type biogenesis protein
MDALILGLSSGASCLASCAPFFAPVLAVEGGSGRARRSGLLGLFLAGRLVAYLAVGALAGALGALAAGFLAPEIDRALLRTSWALGGLCLLAGGLAGLEGPSFCRRLAARERPGLSSFALGLAAGLNVCPPFIAAAGRAAALGSLGGAAYFALFFVGTSSWMLPLALVPRLRAKAAELRAVARLAMIMLGSYFLVVLGLLGWS